MQPDDDLGHIHDGDNRRPIGRSFAAIEREIGDDSGDGARDPRVGELRLCDLQAAFGSVPLPRRGSQLLFAGKPQQILQALLGRLVLCARLTEADVGFVDVLLGDRALAQEPLPIFKDRLLCVERRLGGAQVELCLLSLLWNRGIRGGFECR